MAGDVKVAVVSGAISSSGTGTADFTKAGFGTPKACIVLLSFDDTDASDFSFEGRMSIGFSDFTNHRCITHQDEDGSAKVDCDARKSATKAYVILNVSAAVDVDGTASTIADGVRLTNTTNASSLGFFATVIMFGGADLQVSLDSVLLGNGVDLTTVVTTGIPQDLVFFIGTDIAGEDSSSSGINNSFGVADISNDQATIVNRCMGWTSDHNNNVGAPASIIRNDRCLKVLAEAAGDDWGVELTAATATSYTVTTRDVTPGAGMEVYALALNLDDRGSKVDSVDSPTSGATWTPAVALGFTPQYVGLGVTHAAVEGTIETDADAGGLGISSNTGTGEEAFHGWYNEDASVAANTNNNFRSRVIDLRNDDVTVVVHDHSHSSFNDGDWTYTINAENETTAKKWFYWAIEEASVPPLALDANGRAASAGVATLSVKRAHEATGRSTSSGTAFLGIRRGHLATGRSSSFGSATLSITGGVTKALDANSRAASSGVATLSRIRRFQAVGVSSSFGDVDLKVLEVFKAQGRSSSAGVATMGIRRGHLATGQASSSATANLTKRLGLFSTGRSSSFGSTDLKVLEVVKATGRAASSGSALLSKRVRFQATGQSSSLGSCDLKLIQNYKTVGQTASSGEATLGVRRGLLASGRSTSSAIATLGRIREHLGTGRASSSGTAFLQKKVPIVATGRSSSSATAQLTKRIEHLATGRSTSSGTALLAATRAVKATGRSSSQGVAVLGVKRALEAIGRSTSSSTGLLSKRVRFQAAGRAISFGTAKPTRVRGLFAVGASSSSGLSDLRLRVTVFEAKGKSSSSGTALLGATRALAATGTTASRATALLTRPAAATLKFTGVRIRGPGLTGVRIRGPTLTDVTIGG